MATRIKLDGADELQKRLAALTSPRQALGIIGLRGVAEAKGIVHRRTGNLGRTIRLGTVTDEYVDVIAGGRLKVGYAIAEEMGAKPHIIRPRKAKALRWPVKGSATLAGGVRKGGAVLFARVVRHPGQPAHPYLVPGITKAVRDAGMQVLVRDPWNRAS